MHSSKNMWRYVKPRYILSINNKNLRLIAQKNLEFTIESVLYIRDMLSQLVDGLENARVCEEINNIIREIVDPCDQQKFLSYKYGVVDYVLELMLRKNNFVDSEVIDPWKIYNKIRDNEKISKMVGIIRPPIVETHVRNIFSKLEMSYEHLLGILAIYKYLGREHPFYMYGCKSLLNEMEKVSSRIGVVPLLNKNLQYQVNVGSDVYLFDDMDFLQGLITGTLWEGLIGNIVITNLQTLQYKHGEDIIINYKFVI